MLIKANYIDIKIIAAWIITVPVATVLSAAIYFIISGIAL